MKFYIYGDMKSKYREAFAMSEEEYENFDESNYSGYYCIDVMDFPSQAEADAWIDAYNNYEGEPDVECNCCPDGCTMTACEYAHWNGLCAYTGIGRNPYEDE